MNRNKKKWMFDASTNLLHIIFNVTKHAMMMPKHVFDASTQNATQHLFLCQQRHCCEEVLGVNLLTVSVCT